MFQLVKDDDMMGKKLLEANKCVVAAMERYHNVYRLPIIF
jgi:hypothetical protein